MSRSGSMTRPTPRSWSATRKLELPSSEAGTASTVYTSLAQRDGRGREEDVDRDQRDRDRAAVEKRLRGHALGGVESEVDEEVAQAVREMEERKGDQDEQIELDQRVAEHVDPRVVVAVDDVHEAQRAEDALDQDVDGDEEGGDPPALREHEPPEEVHQSWSAPLRRLRRHLPMNGEGLGTLTHRANQMRTKPTTREASAHIPNMASEMSLEGMVRSRTLTRMITPARLRNV